MSPYFHKQCQLERAHDLAFFQRQQRQQEQREERAQLEMSRSDIQLGQREITYAIMVFSASFLTTTE